MLQKLEGDHQQSSTCHLSTSIIFFTTLSQCTFYFFIDGRKSYFHQSICFGALKFTEVQLSAQYNTYMWLRMHRGRVSSPLPSGQWTLQVNWTFWVGENMNKGLSKPVHYSGWCPGGCSNMVVLVHCLSVGMILRLVIRRSAQPNDKYKDHPNWQLNGNRGVVFSRFQLIVKIFQNIICLGTVHSCDETYTTLMGGRYLLNWWGFQTPQNPILD